MKYFHKLFFSILLILTLAVTAVESAAVSFSLENSFSREKTKALAQHQLVKYSIQAAVLSSAQDGGVSAAELPIIGEKAAALLGNGGFLYFAGDGGEVYYSNLPSDIAPALPEEGFVSYRVVSDSFGMTDLQVESRFSQSGAGFVLATAQYISDVFREADEIRTACTRIYFAVITFGMLAAFLLAWWLTRPISSLQRTSRAIAAGNYQIRSNVKSRDELRELSASFNQMADTIEEKIRELEEAAERQKAFTANFAHELKTPMTSISGFIDGVLDGTIPREKQDYYLKIVSGEVKRLSRLVVSMLNMSKIESGDLEMKPSNYDISDQIIHILLTFEQKIENKNIEIRGLDEFRPTYIVADPDMIYQSIYNLVDNAVKFTNEGGYIDVRLIDSANQITLVIKNSGTGIKAEDLSRVFERFYKADKSRSLDAKGAGLGLYLVKLMVEMHGGRVSAKSESEDSAEFSITLPKQFSPVYIKKEHKKP